MNENDSKIHDLRGQVIRTEDFRTLRYEVLDEVLDYKQLVVTRRLIFTVIEVIKMEKQR